MASTTAVVVSQTPPKTPVSQIADRATSTQTPSPGTWKHPRMAEIARRRRAAVFDASNARRIAYNVVALFASFFGPRQVEKVFPTISNAFTSFTHLLGWYHWLPLLAFHALLIYNIVGAAMPLFREPDNLSDIPLSPSQRVLLGLRPTSGNPNTPDTTFVTPPRYQKSTPRSQSPAGGRDSSGLRGSDRRDGFSPSASPLFARAINGENLRRSFSRDSPLAGGNTTRRGSFGESSGFTPSTPSPGRGATSGVPLNSRWLYEKRKSSGAWR